MNKMTLKVIAGVLAVFLLGGIIGGLGAGIYLRQRVEQGVVCEQRVTDSECNRRTDRQHTGISSARAATIWPGGQRLDPEGVLHRGRE